MRPTGAGRARATAALAALIAPLGGCGGDRAEPPDLPPLDREERLAATPVRVRVYEFGFEPSNVVVKAGQSVAWKAVGKELHRIVPTSRAGERVFLQAERGYQFAHTFREPGVYPYACAIHPQMKAKVTVVRDF